MAITDNTFTAEEFSTAAAANPELLKLVVGPLGANNYVVKTQEEHNALLQNHEAAVVARKTSEHAASIEKDVAELTGIPKGADEKYFEYLKRAFGEKFGSVGKLQKELDDLKAKGGNTSEVDKARIKELEKAVAEKETALTTQLSAKDKELLEMRTTYAIDGALAAFRSKYKAGIPDSLKTLAEKAFIDDLKTRGRMENVDGKPTLVFVGEDNNVIVDKTTFKAAGVDYFIKDSALKDLIEEGTPGGTGGSGTPPGGTGGGKGGNDGGTGKYAGLPGDVKSKTALATHLKQLGVLDGTEEFTKIMDTDGANLPIR